jgi:hypothetical protein
MLIVVSFDTVFFAVLAFWSFDNMNALILSGLISKGFFTLFYSILFLFLFYVF